MLEHSISYILLLGDDSKYSLVDYILNQIGEERQREVDYIVTYYQETLIKKREEAIYLYSSIIPVGRMICIPWYDDGNSFVSKYANAHKIIYCTSFPYNKIDVKELIENTVSGFLRASSMLLFLKEKRRFGATDLDREDDLICATRKEMGHLVETCHVIEDIREITRLVSIQYKYQFFYEKNYCQMVKDKYQEYRNTYDDMYEIYIVGYLYDELSVVSAQDTSNFLNIFKYRNIKDKDSIWEAYFTQFKQRYLEQDSVIIQDVNRLYNQFLFEIITLDIQEQLNQLYEDIMDNLEIYFKYDREIPIPKNELEYRKVLVDENIQVEFQNRVSSFLEEYLREYLCEIIQREFNRIRKIINLEVKNEKDSVNVY